MLYETLYEAFFDSPLIKTINNIEDLHSTKPATDEDIVVMEKELKVKFANDYKEYLKNFGTITGDRVKLTGFSKSKSRDVVQVTKRERELDDGVPKNMYVIEDKTLVDAVAWQDSSGSVYASWNKINHGLRERPSKVANSLRDYIKKKPLQLQYGKIYTLKKKLGLEK